MIPLPPTEVRAVLYYALGLLLLLHPLFWNSFSLRKRNGDNDTGIAIV